MAKCYSKCFTHINSFNNCDGSVGTFYYYPYFTDEATEALSD